VKNYRVDVRGRNLAEVFHVLSFWAVTESLEALQDRLLKSFKLLKGVSWTVRLQNWCRYRRELIVLTGGRAFGGVKSVAWSVEETAWPVIIAEMMPLTCVARGGGMAVRVEWITRIWAFTADMSKA